jgi:hypothetical protein
VHALDHSATVTGLLPYSEVKIGDT